VSWILYVGVEILIPNTPIIYFKNEILVTRLSNDNKKQEKKEVIIFYLIISSIFIVNFK
jgi:hypothetical protein